MFLSYVTRCCSTCSVTIYYSYYDTDPPGKLWDECPSIGDCGGGGNPSCVDGYLEGYLTVIFPKACKRDGHIISATVLGGSTIDDYGTIGGVSTTNICGNLGVIASDTPVSVTLEDDIDPCFVKAKVAYEVHNSPLLGGPYGLANVRIRWEFLV